VGGRADGSRHDRVLRARGPIGALVALLVVLAAAVPAAFGLTGDAERATLWGLFVSGVAAFASAAGIVGWWARARRVGRDAQVWRAVFGLALLVWSIGQLMLWWAAWRGTLAYPAPGDIVSGGAAPAGLAALLCVPRTSVSSWPGLRLALDAIVAGMGASLALRSALLASPHGEVVTDGYGTIVFIVADTSVFSLVLLATIRDVRARLLPAVAGVGAHCVADIGGLYAAADGVRDLPWYSGSLWCLGWPLVAVAVARYRPRSAADADSAEFDRREALASHTATVIGVAFVCATLLSSRNVLVEPGTPVLLGLVVGVIGLREAVGALVRTQLTAGLRQQAHRDPLTGLANRRAVTARMARIDDAGAWIVITLDLDGFKQVNDVLGHQAGDSLLVAVGKAVRRACPADGLAARLGGDEFAVLTRGDLADGARLGERLRLAVNIAMERHSPGLATSVSVGVGRLVRADAGPASGSAGAVLSAGQALSAGDDRLVGLVESAAALRAAKAAGRDRIEVYDADVAAARERRLVLEQRLRRAVATGALESYAQPVVGLRDGRLRGFEALARWTDEELGIVPPVEFIAVAEQTGLVVELGEHLVDVTFARAREAGAFTAGLRVAINVSPIQLRVPGFAELVAMQLDRHEVPARLVTIEVTEAILVADDDPALRTLAELAELGVDLAIDDFGTGYSALGYLRRLPVQVLKIDRSLTTDLRGDAKTYAIVEGVVGMAHRMGIRVIMEGIEEEADAEACRSVDADLGQGWLFGRPVSWAQAAALVEAEVAGRPLSALPAVVGASAVAGGPATGVGAVPAPRRFPGSRAEGRAGRRSGPGAEPAPGASTG
jgi:diguanylate cyclase (GGDEF)-like protein